MVLLPLQARQDRLARALVAAVVRLARRLHGPKNWETRITHTVVTSGYISNKGRKKHFFNPNPFTIYHFLGGPYGPQF